MPALANILATRRIEPLTNMAGLGLWAASQMLLTITLAGALSLTLVGVFALGLTVFSLLMVACGLNLRLAIAVDRENRIAVFPALAIRLGTALVAYVIALVVMGSYAPDRETFVLAAILLGARISDQVADVFYGFQQKLDRTLFLSSSFFLRGLATCLFCLCLFLWRAEPLAVIVAGTAAYTVGSLLLEATWFRGDWRQSHGIPLGVSVREVLRHDNVRSFSTFPMFDAAHFSAFRLAVAPVLDTRAFGLFALAMNAFSATQVLVTALGLTSLARLKAGTREHGAAPVGVMLRDAVLFGGACLAFFALCSLAFGVAGHVMAGEAWTLDLFLLGNFAALCLLPFTGFIAQGSVFYGDRAGYWQAPLAGSLVFAGAAAMLIVLARVQHWPQMTSYLALCGALFASSLLRLGVSLRHLGPLKEART